jgi:hypothetical protein
MPVNGGMPIDATVEHRMLRVGSTDGFSNCIGQHFQHLIAIGRTHRLRLGRLLRKSCETAKKCDGPNEFNKLHRGMPAVGTTRK